MIAFANALVGHFRGGLAMARCWPAHSFAAVSGSAPATVVAVGSVMIAAWSSPVTRENFAAGVICNAGTLGILIPPSHRHGHVWRVTESSIGNLFIAGLLPGIILTIVMMITVAVIARKQDLPRQPNASASKTSPKAVVNAIWGLLLLVIILGGIYAGIFTPTEAAAVSAVYAFVVAVFVYSDIASRRSGRPDESAKSHRMLMFIIANAYVSQSCLTTEQIPQRRPNG